MRNTCILPLPFYFYNTVDLRIVLVQFRPNTRIPALLPHSAKGVHITMQMYLIQFKEIPPLGAKSHLFVTNIHRNWRDDPLMCIGVCIWDYLLLENPTIYTECWEIKCSCGLWGGDMREVQCLFCLLGFFHPGCHNFLFIDQI